MQLFLLKRCNVYLLYTARPIKTPILKSVSIEHYSVRDMNDTASTHA